MAPFFFILLCILYWYIYLPAEFSVESYHLSVYNVEMNLVDILYLERGWQWTIGLLLWRN